MKLKLIKFLNSLLYTSLFLWFFLFVLSWFNLKPNIRVGPFFWIFFIFWVTLNIKLIITYLSAFLIKINRRFKKQAEIIEDGLDTSLTSVRFLTSQLWQLFKNGPALLVAIISSGKFWISLVATLILWDIFFYRMITDLIFLAIIALLVFTIWKTKCQAKILLIFGYAALFFAAILFTFSSQAIANKMCAWSLTFISIGIVLPLFGYRKRFIQLVRAKLGRSF
jgi:hypothetical protein